MSIANKITWIRMLLILPIVSLISLEQIETNFIAMLLFILAGLTDYLDGYIARKTNTESNLGALLDLLADKLLVCIVLIWIITINNTFFYIIPAILMVTRELIITSIRQFVVESEGKNSIKVSLAGKSKTVLQFIAISLIIVSPGLSLWFYNFSLLFLWLATFVSFLSLFSYINAWKKLIN